VDGNGQSELAQAVSGLLPVASGTVLLHDEDITEASVANHRARGLAYVPADRRGVGSVAGMSIAGNAILGAQRSRLWGPFLDRTAIRLYAQTLVERFAVRAAGIDTPAGKLSGGNLQKVLLGREILRGAPVMVVEQPTRGLDAGAVEAVWNELLRERARGAAILLISAELRELMNLADRIAVMYAGSIVGIVDASQTTLQELGAMMTGGAAEAGHA
jgi:simple sugar transport system ATP-binding protein